MLMSERRWRPASIAAGCAMWLGIGVACSEDCPATTQDSKVSDSADADAEQVDIAPCNGGSCLELGVHAIVGFEEHDGLCVLFSKQRLEEHNLLHFACWEYDEKGDSSESEYLVWQAPTGDEINVVALGSAQEIMQAGVIPVVGTDAIWCDWPSCQRIDKTGKTIWTSKPGMHRGARIDGALVRGSSVYVPSHVPSGKAPPSEQRAATELGLATGATLTVWANGVPADGVERMMIRSLREGPAGSILAAGATILDKGKEDGYGDVLYPLVAKLNPDGTFAWTSTLPNTPRADSRAEVAVEGNDNSVLVLVGRRLPGIMGTRELRVERLASEDGIQLDFTELPGLYPYYLDTHMLVGLPFATMTKTQAGRVLVLALTSKFVPPKNASSKHYGEPFVAVGHVLDGFGNLLFSFELPGTIRSISVSDFGWYPSTRAPQLTGSDANGYTIVVDNQEVRVTPWGHASVDAAGLCATLSLDDCADSNPCTNDLCDPKLGCTHPNLPDGATCSTKGTCKAGACVEP